MNELVEESLRRSALWDEVNVTRNMQQAARVSNKTVFCNVSATETGDRTGYLVECDSTKVIFNNPIQEDTKNYVSGRFG